VAAGAGDRRGKKSVRGRVRLELELARSLGIPRSQLVRDFPRRDVNLLLALQQIELDTDPLTGLPFSEVTDAANQFAYVTAPMEMNWAADQLGRDKDRWYREHDTDKDYPMNRAGHIWRVKRRD
jgi:hypothetical protein